jgi:hypothetical protein
LQSVTCQEEGRGEITSPSGSKEYPLCVQSESQRQGMIFQRQSRFFPAQEKTCRREGQGFLNV